MAWVRPKNPPKPVPTDPQETLVPLLSFLSGRRPMSPTKSPPKPVPKQSQLTPRIVSHDPILQSFHHAQQVQERRPLSSHGQRVALGEESRYIEDEIEVEEQVYERRAQRPRPRICHEPEPEPEPEQRMRVRAKPRVASYERVKPRLRRRYKESCRDEVEDERGEPYWAVAERFRKRRSPWD